MNSHDLAGLYAPIPDELTNRLVGDSYTVPVFDGQEPENLQGYRVALVATHGPELLEFHVPISYLRANGASVDVLTQDWVFDEQMGQARGMIVLVEWLTPKVAAKADRRISDASAVEYDALIVIGGAWNPIMLRTDDSILQFIREACAQGKLVAAICHGPQVLISAQTYPAGTRVTGVDDIRVDLCNAGFLFENESIVYDESQRLLTCRNPDSLQAFCEELGSRAHHALRMKGQRK